MTDITAIGLTHRTTRALQRANIHTIETLQSKSLVELAELQGVGEVALLEVIKVGFLGRPVVLRRGDHICPRPSSKSKKMADRIWAELV